MSKMRKINLKIFFLLLYFAIYMNKYIKSDNINWDIYLINKDSIEANMKYIKELNGIESFENITSLDLGNNLIENIEPIADLIQLKEIICLFF